MIESGAFTVGTSPRKEEPTNSYRWRRKFFFRRTLERAWKVTYQDGNVWYDWKEIPVVPHSSPDRTLYIPRSTLYI